MGKKTWTFTGDKEEDRTIYTPRADWGITQTKEVNIAQVPKNSNPQSKTGTSQRQKELHQLWRHTQEDWRTKASSVWDTRRKRSTLHAVRTSLIQKVMLSKT